MVAMRQAALVSDESALEACLRRCAIQIDDLLLIRSSGFKSASQHSLLEFLNFNECFFIKITKC